MPIEMKVFITANENGISTSIDAEGVCNKEESEQLEFIYKAITTALKTREGQRVSESGSFNSTAINGSTQHVH
ncbi:hypothetical protein EHW65_07900 [Erwinia psidii]|uniref:hypothetical protein n=1 Tax=Erwinia psidii TaxID=69224 RepID=UPI00226B44A4|nr:hypothetical protein [Erwinia psidii]MCX8957194.1 hypothetical protein [Erwinia psidii]